MSRTALIDADGLIYIVTYCKQKRDENGMPLLNDLGHPDYEEKTLDQCKDSMDDIIKNILLATNSDSYLLFLTVGRNFRYDIYPEYKANRKSLEKPKHFDGVKEFLITKYQAVYFDGLEADDLCLIYKKLIPDSFIASPDKDMLALEGTHYNYSKGYWTTVDEDQAWINFWSSMVTGDTADNIKGIPGSGPAKVKKMLEGTTQTKKDSLFHANVFMSYLNKFGEEEGMDEFYKNYKVLKIKDKYGGVLPYTEPIKFEVNEQEERDTW